MSRSDDSVVRLHDGGLQFLRRSRGWVPVPVSADGIGAGILACGAHLKNTIALTRSGQVFVSQHIGDLENLPALEFFKSSVAHLEKVIEIKPKAVAHDLHPDYLSTRFALDLEGLTKVGVQHHHAHIASCLGETGHQGPVIGVALDGTGYGPDGTIWGCEVLVADRKTFERVAHLELVGMPGGDKAVRQPWRMALAHLQNALGDELGESGLEHILKKPAREIRIVSSMLRKRVNCPVTSSCGRLFDAVSALCGVRPEASYEGQAAVELEMCAADDASAVYAPSIEAEGDGYVIGCRSLISAVLRDLEGSVDIATISAKFHNWLAESLLDVVGRVSQRTDLRTVALSGGCFQNRVLLDALVVRLRERGFEVLTNRMVPPNDGGISFGQAVVASARLEGE